MKRTIIYIVTFIICLGVWQACIDDESVGAIRELSKINITSDQDTLYVDFGMETTIEASITQTGEGNMTYEWAWGAVNSEGGIKDSLVMISEEPVLHYSFRKLGEFRVRLRVTNDDGSSFYYFKLFVRTPFQEGLLVLSEDENKIGRTSFLRTKEPKEVVTGKEEFSLHGCEAVNPEIVLNAPRDISWYNKKLLVLSDGGKIIHQYDKMTFDYLNSIRVDQEYPGAALKKICLAELGLGGLSFGWGENKETWLIDYDMGLVTPDTRFTPGEKYDKLHFHGKKNVLFINFEESYINHALGTQMPSKRYSSEEIFKGRYIVNVMADEGNKLHVVTTDPNDPLSVRITYFDNMEAMAGLFVWRGAFWNPRSESYRATQPLTLTRDADMLTNPIYYVTYYARGNELYEWVYKGFELPNTPLLTLDGEITCLALSPDNKYVYLGVWNPAAKEELKGSVYILDMDTKTIIRQYRGVADKPVKIFYKKDN